MELKRAYLYTLIIILFTAVGFSGGFVFRSMLEMSESKWQILDQVYQILSKNGLKDLPADPTLEYGMIRGMLQAYDDPYTMFVEPAQHELESNTLEGKFGGIGVRLGRDEEGNVVLYPLPNSPAQDAGILENDRLIKVDDLNITPQTNLDTIQAAIRGRVGHWITITIARPPDNQLMEFRIKRAEIALPSVTSHIDPDEPRLGVIEINLISASTPDEITKAFKDLSQRGASAFILDLRDNSGGLLNSGVEIARLFLKSGVIIEQQYKGKQVERFSVEKPGTLAETPIAILINGNTASAAEIIAGAIKANQRAKLVGHPTYGKNTIQLVFDLKDGSSLHVTSARWWIPGLEPPIEGNGVEPDIWIDESDSHTPEAALLTASRLLFGEETP